MKDVGISIGTPSFNRKCYLANAIDSCSAFTVQCETIICDHGSSDKTEKFILDA